MKLKDRSMPYKQYLIIVGFFVLVEFKLFVCSWLLTGNTTPIYIEVMLEHYILPAYRLSPQKTRKHVTI